MQKARRSSIQSTKTYKAFQVLQPQDLLQAFQFYKDIPVIHDIPDIPVIHDIPALQASLHVPAPSSTNQYLPVLSSVPVYPGNPPITALQHSSIRNHILILHTDWFPPETSLSTSRRHSTNLHSSKKGRCYDMGQNDTIGKIELIPSSVLSENKTNYKNDIHKFSNSLSYQESTDIPIYTSRC